MFLFSNYIHNTHTMKSIMYNVNNILYVRFIVLLIKMVFKMSLYDCIFIGAENNILLSKSYSLWIHWSVKILHLKKRQPWMNGKWNCLHVITSNWLSVLPQMRPVTHKLTCENGFDPHAQTVKRVSDSVCACVLLPQRRPAEPLSSFWR